MTEWRRSASKQVQDDVDAVLASALDRAVALLKQDAFAPFHAVVNVDGAVELLDAGRAVDAARCRAVASATADSAQIRIDGEHREGVALLVRVPYRRTFLGGVKLAAMRVDAGRRRFWR